MLRRRRASLIAIALVLFALIVVFAVRKPANRALFPPKIGAPVVGVYLIDNGFHTSLALPQSALQPDGALALAAAQAGPPKPFVEVGWGDARFYIESGVSLHRVLDGFRAAFAPNNPSAVMVEPLRAAPDLIWRDGVHRIDLSEAGFRALEASIDRSFALRGGKSVFIPGGAEARFYRSTEHFSAAHLCNHWAAERLNAAGIPTRPVLDTLPAGLVFDLEISGVTVQRNPGADRRPTTPSTRP
ncbi:MAG TPA: DUF2459 domain-containing protein [Caulobacteraceae bacterium]|nr:DUF2459 domain-containing protein [Caulobacteraceae bacterium]